MDASRQTNVWCATLLLLTFCNFLLGQDRGSTPFEERAGQFKTSQDVASELPAAGDIVERYILALGGYEVLSSLDSTHYICRATKVGQNREQFDYEVYNTGSHYSAIYQYENGRRFERRITPEIGWSNTNGTIRVFGKEEHLDFMQKHHRKNGVTNWMTCHKTVETAGEESIDGRRHFKVRFVLKTGKETIRFFDAETGLIRRSIAVEKYGGQWRQVSRDYLDYQWFGEVLAPVVRKVQSTRSGGASIVDYEFRLKLYETNVKIPKQLFDMPPKVANQLAAKPKLPR